MNQYLMLGLLGIVLIAGCVGSAGQDMGIQSVFKIDIVKGGSEDITVQAEIPEFVRAERKFDLVFMLTPAQEISDLSLNVFDRSSCPFINGTKDSWYVTSIRGNHTTKFSTNYSVGKIAFEKDCIMKFKASYSSNASTGTTVAVIEENDYMEREMRGTLGEIPLSSWSSVSPLKIGIRGLEQPLIDNQRVDLHIDYSNTGVGNIDALEPGSVVINLPGNLLTPDCDDYEQSAQGLTLKRRLEFSGGSAKSSSCTLTAKAWIPVDSRPLGIAATYTYQLLQQVTIKARPV